ncbi:MAG: ABC transporter permease, partial [Bacteroidota bacterium]
MNRNRPVRARLAGAGSLLGLLLLWQVAAVAVGREFVLPGPAAAFRALASLAGDGAAWRHLGATLLRGLLGFALSYLAGLAAGLAAGLSLAFAAAFRPLLAGLRSAPTMALTLLALLWFRADTVAVFVTFLVVFPLVTQAVADGVAGVDPALVEMARLYRVRGASLLRRLYLPAVLPHLTAAATSGLGLTWKVMVSAEILAAPRWGVGARLDGARTFLNAPEVFAW